MQDVSDLDLEKAAAILKTVSHPIRLKIISLLGSDNELSVNEIAAQTNNEQSLTSHHLNSMKMRGLIKSRREGKQVLYSLYEKQLLALLECIKTCNCYFG